MERGTWHPHGGPAGAHLITTPGHDRPGIPQLETSTEIDQDLR